MPVVLNPHVSVCFRFLIIAAFSVLFLVGMADICFGCRQNGTVFKVKVYIACQKNGVDGISAFGNQNGSAFCGCRLNGAVDSQRVSDGGGICGCPEIRNRVISLFQQFFGPEVSAGGFIHIVCGHIGSFSLISDFIPHGSTANGYARESGIFLFRAGEYRAVIQQTPALQI